MPHLASCCTDKWEIFESSSRNLCASSVLPRLGRCQHTSLAVLHHLCCSFLSPIPHQLCFSRQGKDLQLKKVSGQREGRYPGSLPEGR